jgi:hypothetical protein
MEGRVTSTVPTTENVHKQEEINSYHATSGIACPQTGLDGRLSIAGKRRRQIASATTESVSLRLRRHLSRWSCHRFD